MVHGLWVLGLQRRAQMKAPARIVIAVCFNISLHLCDCGGGVWGCVVLYVRSGRPAMRVTHSTIHKYRETEDTKL